MPTKFARLVRAIKRAAKQAGKSFTYDDTSPLNEPIQYFFQESDEGLILFVVFRTLACAYSMCTFCPLPETSTLRQVEFRDINKQIDYIFRQEDVRVRAQDVTKLIVSNQGSILDERTFSSLSLMHLIVQAETHLPNLATFCIETRPEFVDDDELVLLARAMAEGDSFTQLEIAIGFEAFDDRIRNTVLRKGLVLRGEGSNSFESLVRRVAHHKFRLKCYFLQKPTEHMNDQEAMHDVMGGIDFLAEMAGVHGALVSMHLNPTFVPAGTQLEAAFQDGSYLPPRLTDVITAVLHAEESGIQLYVGLDDEGLAIPGGSFVREGEERLVEALHAFNKTQDYDALREVLGTWTST